MVVVFSNVIADISPDFVQKVANGGRVDFLGMLRRICEVTRVEVIIDITKCNEYKLKGPWRLISKAHSLLVKQSATSVSLENENRHELLIENFNHSTQFDNDIKSNSSGSKLEIEPANNTRQNDLSCCADGSEKNGTVDVDEILVSSWHGDNSENGQFEEKILSNLSSREEVNCVGRRGKRKISRKPKTKTNASNRCLRQARFEGSYAVDQESEEDCCKNVTVNTSTSNVHLSEHEDCSLKKKEGIADPDEGIFLSCIISNGADIENDHIDIKEADEHHLNDMVVKKVQNQPMKKKVKVKVECSDKVEDHKQSTSPIIATIVKPKRANKRKLVYPKKVQNLESTMSVKRNVVNKKSKRFDFSKSKLSSINRHLSSSLLTRSLLLKKRGRPKKYSTAQSNLSCSECDFIAKTRNALGDHKHRIHLAKPSKCDVCEKVFPNARYMRRHRTSHVDPQHCCDICGKMYKILKALRDHRKTHDEGYARPQFPCSQCSKKFCTRYIMECHIKSEHLGQKRSFLCSTCGKSFTTKHTLQQHVNVHSGVKPYTCGICDKSFSYESALRDHKYIHTGMKKFVCLICHKAFRQRSALKMHEKIHLEKKEFTCQDCGRGFTQKQALQRHERAHKGLKPFSCKLCGRTFGDASIIRRHMILVHKINKDPSTWREDIIMKAKTGDASSLENVKDGEETPTQVKSKPKSNRMSKKALQKSWTLENMYNDENCQKTYKNVSVDQEAVMNVSSDSSSTVTDHLPQSLSLQTSFHPLSSTTHPITDPCSVPSHPYPVETTATHLHSIDYQYQNTHSIDPARTAYPYISSGPSQVADPRYQRMCEVTTAIDDNSSKRIHEMEPPDNLSISSLYAYYTNLASQYINVNAYPNYMQPSENSNQDH